MTKTPSLTSRDVVRLLKKRGFVLDRVKGSHHVFMLPDRSKRVIVPMHNRDIPVGTLLSILEQAGIDKDELL